MKALAISIGALGFIISQLLIFAAYENRGGNFKGFIKKYYTEIIIAFTSYITLILIFFIDDKIINWLIEVSNWLLSHIKFSIIPPDSLIIYILALFAGMMNVAIIKTGMAIFKAILTVIKKYIINKINKLIETKKKKNGIKQN